ncbi:hypothetical protein [Comamonas endophytica]|uniref:Uncharacterized protein n=1 Tax=Comamonas endophytica TaxID=2949090 RepID=A0ABY6G6R8_9BURK|nr:MULTISPECIES: hypothetical protein [unclassified Acidovorax]MCD2511205.1 hypothetical protein [Acidovorax sp. D4N7]UYG50603.1 hypothetical protein M9799_10895 [Acidovorax sp. 5MLIR]
MHRCSHPSFARALAASLVLLGSAAALPVQAQPVSSVTAAAAGTRNFPPDAQRGKLVIGTMPEVTLNGKAIRTTPGFRLFSAEGRLLMAHTLAGQNLLVNYVIEPSTQWLHAAWILTPEEAALKRP